MRTGATALASLTLQLTARVAIGGDATLDDVVNLTDLNVLAANFGQGDRAWQTGDFNRDTVVNLSDFNILAANFGLSASAEGLAPHHWAALASAVPEPCVVLATVLAVPVLRRARRAPWSSRAVGGQVA